MFEAFFPSLRLTLLTFLLCGLAYPLFLTGIAQLFFPHQANGSLIGRSGSALVGQRFDGPGWFHGRISSIGYQAESSGSSNYGPTNRALLDRVASDSLALRAANPSLGSSPIPVDLLTQSGSGLDPHLSPAAALLQVPRVARARGIPEARLRTLVLSSIEHPDLALFGVPRVNVLKLNLALGGRP